MSKLTPLNRPMRRRVVIEGKAYVLCLYPETSEIGLRRLRTRKVNEMRLPWTALMEGGQIPLFPKETEGIEGL